MIMDITCDNCQRSFDSDKWYNSKTVDGVDVIFFCCPGCDLKRLSYVADEEVKRQLEEIRKLANSSDTKVGELESLKNKIRKTQAQKKEQYKDIINKVIGT